MKQLIIHEFTIVDYRQKVGNSFYFGEKMNLVISKDNEVGKSSLLKSMYYTLGAKIKSFPKGWDFEKYIFQMSCTINDSKVKICRFADAFSVVESGQKTTFSNEKDFSQWVQEKMEMGMYLPIKNSENKYSLAYMNAVLLPFYIDQDNSWGSLYKDAIEGLYMYEKQPKIIFDYYFGLSTSKLNKLEEDRKSLAVKLNGLDTQIKELLAVFESYRTDNDVDDISFDDLKKLEKEVDYYIEVNNHLNEQIEAYIKKISYSESKLNSYYHDFDEMENLLEISDKRINEIEFECSYCHSYLTREQSLTRLELFDNLNEIEKKKIIISGKIAKEEEQLNNWRTNISELQNDFDERNEKIKRISKMNDINDFVRRKVSNELKSLMLKYEREKASKNEVLNEILSEIKDENKKIKKRKTELKNIFENKKYDYQSLLKNQQSDTLKFLSFSRAAASGTSLNKIYLAAYLIYLQMLYDRSDFMFPITIDSFIKNEISTENEEQMFRSVRTTLENMNVQSFFSVIDRNVKYFNTDKCSIIELNKPLLREENYDSISSDLII